MTNLDEMLKEVIDELRPSPDKVAAIDSVARRLVKRLEHVFGVGRVSVEGSYAKGTMVRGREEADIFVHFESSVPISEACRMTVEEGVKSVLEENGAYKLRYANHPYVEGYVQGIRVNIVPCYDSEYGKWITPVDRTPHHTRYIKTRITAEKADQVRLLKAFLMNDGLYGAEVRVRGFSGYVCELLVLRYGSFLSLIVDATSWKPPVILDNSSHLPEAPLVLPDPVDPHRNTAAAVSLTTLSNFIMKSKLFLKKPSRKFFLEENELNGVLDGRSFLALTFDVPEQPPDVLWGELNRTLGGIRKALELLGFRVLRGDRWVEHSRGLLVFELESKNLPTVYLNKGPPVWTRNAVEFIDEQMRKSGLLAYPWVEGDRLFSLLERKHTDAEKTVKMLIEKGIASVSKELKPHLRNAETYTDVKLLMDKLSDDERNFLRDFVRACPNYVAHYVSST